MTNELEYREKASNDLYKTHEGRITTPYERIDFLVKQPHELVDQHPIQFYPGFTDGVSGSDRITNAYAERRKMATTLNYPRVEHPEYINDPEGHKVHSGMLVLSAMRSLYPDLEEFDVQGHSEGGSNASRAVCEYPEDFRTLTVLASGGLIEGDSMRKIFMRASRNPQTHLQAIGQMLTHPGYSGKISRSSFNYVRSNPFKARNEAARIASADIRNRFVVISKSKGVRTGALQFNNDVLFPLKLVRRSTGNGEIFDLFKVYPFKDATHTTPQNHPRTVAEISMTMISELATMKDSRVI